ncbi:MAG: AraC family transcriptional regulator [Bacteroidota bacterium]
MEFFIDVRQNILEQFAGFFGLETKDGVLAMDAPMGSGRMQFLGLPNQLELYHLTFQVNFPFSLSSANPSDSEWLLLNINLSKGILEKTVNDTQVNIQRYLPTGMLFYPPGIRVFSTSPPGEVFEIALVRFHRSLLELYDAEQIKRHIPEGQQTVIYEDLDHRSEALLRESICLSEKKILIHAKLLELLAIFFEKLMSRSADPKQEQLHPDDLDGLFLAAAHLRNPFANTVPGIPELAAIANMGTTKFKTSFKQVFGLPPMKYHQKIRMDFAHDQLQSGAKSPTELSYDLGYSHPSKFTQAFKKQFGRLPSEVYP